MFVHVQSVFNAGMSTAGRTTSTLQSNRKCRSAVPVPGFKNSVFTSE